MMQHEITTVTPLLSEEGALSVPGFSRHNYFEYDPGQFAKKKWRFKEWNFYQISDGEHMVQINIFNIGLATSLSAVYLNLKTGKVYTDGVTEVLTPHKNHLDTNGEQPSLFTYVKNGRSGRFEVTEEHRHISYSGQFKGRAFQLDFRLEHLPNHESLITATPFDRSGQFFLTQKMNCMPASGFVRLGQRKKTFDKAHTFGIMDWGRGVWPYSNMWYWANGSTLIDGKPFGFELTWGFGDTKAATATALFYDGICHKLGPVYLENDPEVNDSWMEPWHFMSDDGRLDLTMTPFYDYMSGAIPCGLIGMKSHQVHGRWNGTVTLDDGTILEIKDMYAFCEKVYNKW